MRRRIAIGVVVALLAARAAADEVVFRNGDRLTGTVAELGDGKITLKGTVAGDVTVSLSDVRTFSTAEPIELHLEGGTVLRERVEADADGRIRVPEGGTVAPQSFELARLEKINPPPVEWKGSLTASALVSRGNSESESFHAALDLVRRAEDDRITVGAGRSYASQEDADSGEDETTTDSWFGAVKYDWFVDEQLFVYANARVERDRVARLRLRFTPGLGVGYQWVEREDLNFSTEGGLTWVYEDFYGDTDSDSHLALRLAYHFDTQLNDDVSLFHDVEYLPSLEGGGDYNLNAAVGVRANFTDAMFGEFKVEMRYDRTPADGAEKRDLFYTLGVGWKF